MAKRKEQKPPEAPAEQVQASEPKEESFVEKVGHAVEHAFDALTGKPQGESATETKQEPGAAFAGHPKLSKFKQGEE